MGIEQNWDVLCDAERRIVLQRNSKFWQWMRAWVTIDCLKLPTTLTVQFLGHDPLDAMFRLEIGHVGQFETHNDRRRCERFLEEIVGRLTGKPATGVS